jgi:hypothetical protein
MPTTPPTKLQLPQSPSGLCGDCRHARLIESAKGSHFLLCQLSQSDSRFPKYPPLPVLTCAGYVHAAPASAYNPPAAN